MPKARSQMSESERAAKVLEGWSRPINQRLEIQKWENGVIVVGALISTKKLPDDVDAKGNVTKNGGHIFTIEPEGEPRVCYGAPTLLWETIESMKLGTEMRIECLGQTIKSKRGQNAWAFDVRTREMEG